MAVLLVSKNQIKVQFIEIDCPVRIVWGSHGTVAHVPNRRDLWLSWCRTVSHIVVDSGHYVAEENPEGLLAATLPFLL